MSNALTKQDEGQLLEQVIIKGDLKDLSSEQRSSYYLKVCESLGLNPLTKPFNYINLGGRLVLYACRDATDQLRKLHHVSVTISDRKQVGDIYTITAKAVLPDGRADESVGAVNLAGLKGDPLANAFMKCETKAKRRVTLSIVGLGFLDETEVESIPDAAPPKARPAIADTPSPVASGEKPQFNIGQNDSAQEKKKITAEQMQALCREAKSFRVINTGRQVWSEIMSNYGVKKMENLPACYFTEAFDWLCRERQSANQDVAENQDADPVVVK